MYHWRHCPYHCGTADGSILRFIIFYAFKFVLSYSLVIPKLEAPPSIQFFILKALLRKYVVTLFLFFSGVSISSLVLLTLVGGFCGLSF
jgi:hypothetical protein